MEPENFWEKNLLTLAILFLGVIFIGLGVLGFKAFSFSSSPTVEILSEQDQASPDTTIKAEIAGEVIRPGLYELKEGSRVNDLLIAGGGLSAKADREWVSKNVNLAKKVIDGDKIYIPSKQIPNSKSQISNNDQNSNDQMAKININTASAAELDTLWGVGEATAKKIIDGRPYQRLEELLEKKIIKSNVWEEIKDKVTVY